VCEFGELRIVEDGDNELSTRVSNFASAATSNGGVTTTAAPQRPASSSALLDSSACIVNNHSTMPLYSSVDSIVTNEFSTWPC